MKTAEWFVNLNYGKINFLIPQVYVRNSDSDDLDPSGPANFIDFDLIAHDLFEADPVIKRRSCINSYVSYSSMITAKSMPELLSFEYRKFHIPKGVLENFSKKYGIIAWYFEEDRAYIIINPEILNEKMMERCNDQSSGC